MAEGEYPLTVFGISGIDTATTKVRLSVVSNEFSNLALHSPVFGTVGESLFPLLRWNGVPDADTYELQLATSPSFETATLIKAITGLKVDTLQWNVALDEGSVYYWRIRPVNTCGAGPWTEPFVFATVSKTCIPAVANDLPKVIPSNGTPTVESKIPVSNGGTISELRITNVEGNHTFFRDLTATLVGPSGTQVVLFDKKCASYSGNFKLGFSDSAPTAFGCPPPQNGNLYRPQEALSLFNGQNANGNWILRVKDNNISSGGDLTGFAIEFCTQVTLNPPLLVNNNLLEMATGSNAALSTALLKAEDANTPAAQLVYTLVTTPKYGHIERAWSGALQPGQQFTQTDIDNGLIRYFNYGFPTPEDRFHFSVTDGDGGLAAGVFHIRPFPVSTETPAHALAFSLAPNPATETIRLTFSQALDTDAQVFLLNAAGQLMQHQTMAAGTAVLEVELDNIPAGVYLISVQSGNGRQQRKLVKGGR